MMKESLKKVFWFIATIFTLLFLYIININLPDLGRFGQIMR